MPRVRRLAANLIVACATVLVLLGLFETGTRLFAKVGPTLIVKDPRLGKRYVAGYDGIVYVPEAHRDVHLRFNRDGFRGPDRAEGLPPGVRRVAVIGDSMTVAVAVDEDDTFVARLEHSLNAHARPSGTWEALNFGVSSASTGQELVVYKEVAARYRPRVVICAFYVGNDFADNSIRLTRAPRLYFDLDPQDRLTLESKGPGASPVADWLDQHSRFYVWQKTAFAALRSQSRDLRRALDPGHRIFETSADPNLEHAWRLTEHLLVAFRDAVEADGAAFVLAVVPSADLVVDEFWGELLERANGVPVDRELPERRLREIAERHGIRIVAMAGPFRDAMVREPGQELFLNRRHHLNEAGHALVARLLEDAVVAASGP